MNSFLRTLTLTSLCLVLTGCVGISIGNRASNPRTPPPAPLPVAGASDAATMAEIDAATKLKMDSDRLGALLQIATRPDLSPASQVHLVNCAYRGLSFDSSKVQLLRALIKNPAFGDSTRHAIVTQLEYLPMESSRRSILDDISRRMASR